MAIKPTIFEKLRQKVSNMSPQELRNAQRIAMIASATGLVIALTELFVRMTAITKTLDGFLAAICHFFGIPDQLRNFTAVALLIIVGGIIYLVFFKLKPTDPADPTNNPFLLTPFEGPVAPGGWIFEREKLPSEIANWIKETRLPLLYIKGVKRRFTAKNVGKNGARILERLITSEGNATPPAFVSQIATDTELSQNDVHSALETLECQGPLFDATRTYRL